MAIPGNNLLRQAMRLIKPIKVGYERYAGRQENDYGGWVTAYEDRVDILASVQAVDRARYEYMGLDLSRNYVTLYTSHDVGAIERDKSPDRFILPNGKIFTAVSDTDWYGLDGAWVSGAPGWSAVLAVENAPTPSAPT